jgi:hypothetical protein
MSFIAHNISGIAEGPALAVQKLIKEIQLTICSSAT